MQAGSFAGQSVRFCEAIGNKALGRALNLFRERLNFGVKNELLPLMKLPSCNRDTARLLVKNRISGPLELADLTVEIIAGILAQKRGDDRPFQSEIDLATRLLDEATQVASQLRGIEELENSAVANAMRAIFGRS
jgi:DNA polymerase theta